MVNLPRPNKSIHIHHALCTTKTRAQFWNMGDLGAQDEFLDDTGLRAKLEKLDSFWTNDRRGKFALMYKIINPRRQMLRLLTPDSTVLGDPSATYRPLQIDTKSLKYLIKVGRFDEEMTLSFFTSRNPSISSYLQYCDKTHKPESMIILFRCPRNSKYLMGCVRFQVASQNCLAFMSSVLAEDIYGVWTRCQSNTDLLKVHPLYLLAFVYEQRYHTWADWAASLWNQVAEIETATNMTSPTWKREVEVDRLRSLSTSGTLLNEVHATHVELSHSDSVLRFGLKMGRYCLDLVAEAENKRQELGFDTLPVWYKSALEARLKYTLTQCESLSDKLLELKNRLSGQIEVSYNLIAQKNSLVNLAVAQKQANDSRTVKAIAVLTLICLPSTLVATLWTAGLFRLEGNTNWQVFIAVSFALTLVVLLCWRLYVLVSERWKQSPDIDHLFIA